MWKGPGRFKCTNTGCLGATFAEQVDGLTRPHARHMPRLRAMLTSVAVSMAARGGVRPESQLVRSHPEPQVGAVRVVAVYDFALRKRRTYATIVVDLEAWPPVEVLHPSPDP
ncbi:hypothetical protein ACQEU6_01635 [Spirillospora sp. CA-108201]